MRRLELRERLGDFPYHSRKFSSLNTFACILLICSFDHLCEYVLTWCASNPPRVRGIPKVRVKNLALWQHCILVRLLEACYLVVVQQSPWHPSVWSEPLFPKGACCTAQPQQAWSCSSNVGSGGKSRAIQVADGSSCPFISPLLLLLPDGHPAPLLSNEVNKCFNFTAEELCRGREAVRVMRSTPEASAGGSVSPQPRG